MYSFNDLDPAEYSGDLEARNDSYPRARDLEVRSLPITDAELRVKDGAKGPVIYGYAARFNKLSEDLGGFQEQLDSKAFDEVMEKCDCRALINHDANLLMGRTASGTLRLGKNTKGLTYEFDLPDSAIAQHYARAIERGDMTGSSFSFTVHPGDQGATWDYSRVVPLRTVVGVRDLFDVGPVTYPAYTDTSVASRSLNLKDPIPDRALLDQRILKLRLFFLRPRSRRS